MGGKRGSPGSLERRSRILPFRQSVLANKAELDLKCPCNRHVPKCRGPSHTRRRRRPRARTGVESGAPARASGAARDTLEAQLKKRPTSSATACGPCPARTGTASTAASRSAGRTASAARRSAAREVVLSRRAHGARGFLSRYPSAISARFFYTRVDVRDS